jgi:undecaprenyl pyrophosphate phosphatase UppP
MKSKHVASVGIGIAAILAIPLIAMLFTDELQWTLFDFVIAGALLFVAGLTYGFAVSRARNPRDKVAIGIAVAAVLFIIWAQLAVGIIPGVPGGA